ncbi:MAG: hypothetical protein HUJ68_05620 [Clostridia bacterium]|nr:hypothetical protein [Clostridia bacterium]
MKNIKKIIVLIVIILMICSNLIVYADFGLEDLGGDNAQINQENIEQVKGIGIEIVGMIQAVGIVLSVIILTVLGLKYMMGSVEEKAEYKKNLKPYFIGSALVFGASAFAQYIYNFILSL